MKNAMCYQKSPNRLLQQALKMFDQPEECQHSQAFRSKRLGAIACHHLLSANVETLTPRKTAIELEIDVCELAGEGA